MGKVTGTVCLTKKKNALKPLYLGYFTQPGGLKRCGEKQLNDSI